MPIARAGQVARAEKGGVVAGRVLSCGLYSAEQIAAIAFQNKSVVYDILFRATAETLLTIARDPQHLGAEIGFFCVLHTWEQNLQHHPHLHCVVPGGGVSSDYERSL
jgi:hypothetical protein